MFIGILSQQNMSALPKKILVASKKKFYNTYLISYEI